MLEARNVTVAFRERRLLDDVSVQVAPGETVAILGENGAGKTTLLRALAGDRQPPGAHQTGDVMLAGRPIRAWSLPERARLRAVLPQRPELAFAFNAREVAGFGRYAYRGGWRSPQDDGIADAALRLTDAFHLADREVITLSGGEQARVHLASVFAQLWELHSPLPRFLLLDEPTAALDLAHQHQLLETARGFAQERGIGVVAILHDLNLAAMYADRVLVLLRGAVVAQGTPREVLQPMTIAEAFSVAAQVLPHPLIDGMLIATASRRPAAAGA
jgi:iron complex transport system ATP-binding protein